MGMLHHRYERASVEHHAHMSSATSAQRSLSPPVAVALCIPACLQDRRAFLQYAAKGCMRFDLNRPAWALESDVKQLGGLIYW
jgi:hypothetical protein